MQKPWVSAPAFFGNHLAVSATDGYSRGGFGGSVPVSMPQRGWKSADTDGVDFLPLLAESYPPETKYEKHPHSHNKQQSLHHKVEGLLF